MRFANKAKCDRGATAIEYAIIAGVIGLGLVGSLVTTRGSLSAIFGTAGTQMSSATPDAAAAPAAPTGFAANFVSTSPRAAFWNAKSLVADPVVTTLGSTITTKYTFTDGTVATYAKNTSAGNYSVTLRQGDAGLRYNFYGNGNIDQGIMDFYAPGTNTYTKQEFANPVNNTVSTSYVNTFVNGTMTQKEGQPSQLYLTTTANTIEDAKVFAAGLAPK